MNLIEKGINLLTTITRYVAYTVLGLMMLFITISVISRVFFTPILGSIELVELGMVALIMSSLAYTHQIEGHITIDLIVDKFPYKLQKLVDVVSNLLVLTVTFVIAYIYFNVMLFHKNEIVLQSPLLNIPFYPFDFLITLGFFLWGLQGILKTLQSFIELFNPSPNTNSE